MVTPHGGGRRLNAAGSSRATCPLGRRLRAEFTRVCGMPRNLRHEARALVGQFLSQGNGGTLASRAFGVVRGKALIPSLHRASRKKRPRRFRFLQGTPALRQRAGTGDIACGSQSFAGAGVSAYDACVAGTFVHARAGVLASAYLGETTCVTAEDSFEPPCSGRFGACAQASERRNY